MTGFLRRRGPTVLAVALAFLVGGATVTTAQNLITSADIQDGTIKSADIRNGGIKRGDLANNLVNSAKIADGTVKRADFANNSVNSGKIADGGVGNVDLAGNAVNSAKIASGGVANADLANNSVNSAKVADNTLTAADLANGAVGNAELANNAVNSAKVADNTLTAADLANGAVGNAELANNAVNSAKIQDGQVTSADIADGTIQTGDISAAAQRAYTGANWNVVHRNVVGNGDTELGAGPGFVQVGEPPDAMVEITPAPFGVGSLAIRTGSNTDKAAFGNALDFLGDPVAGLTAVSFHVFTTGENIDINPANLPNISIEILANLEPVAGDYTTMVFTPPNTNIPGWHEFDATTGASWWLTGTEGTELNCTQATMCTLQEVKDRLAADGGTAALIGTVTVAKGADFAFSGAVDGLRINDTVYDFEPNGVFETAP